MFVRDRHEKNRTLWDHSCTMKYSSRSALSPFAAPSRYPLKQVQQTRSGESVAVCKGFCAASRKEKCMLRGLNPRVT